MNGDQPFGSESLPLSLAQRVDEACDRFEKAWKVGQGPRIEEYLAEVPELDRVPLLRELLALEIELRGNGGERPTWEEYHRRFREHSELIRAAFANSPCDADNSPSGDSAGATTPYQPATSSSAVGPNPRPPPVSLPAPDHIGRYQVIRRLGGGTFGDVYLAHDGVMDRQVAIKVPSAWLVATARAQAEFLREARSVARLQHEGIVRAYDFGQEADGRCYLVYEYIAGESLAERTKTERLAGDPLPPEEATRIVAQVAEALHYAHLQGLVHRDLKPANILLDRQGKPKLADFGLAVREEGLARERGRLAGTLPYMSPEQVRREGHRLDGRSDIYSLGVVLYELLCGRRPFTATTEDELIDQILHREARPPRQIKDSILPEPERICLKALSKQINDRYTTAADLAKELQRVAERDRVPANLSRPTGIRPDEWYALMEAAHGGKRTLLPTRPPLLTGYEFYLSHEPANAWGDFYDFIQVAESRLAVVLGEGLGKDLSAAVFTMKMVRSLRSLAPGLADPASVVIALNQRLTELGLFDRLATLLYLCIDTANHTVSVVNAGHVCPFIRRKGSAEVGCLVDPSQSGLPIGYSTEGTYETVTVPLEPGDTVLLITTGVSEAISPEFRQSGCDLVVKAFETATLSPARVGEAVVKAVHVFTAGQRQSGDRTVIAFARKEQPDAPRGAIVTPAEQARRPNPVTGAPTNEESIRSAPGKDPNDLPGEGSHRGATVIPRLLRIEQDGQAAVIQLTSNCLRDEQAATRLRAEFRAFLERPEPRQVTLDMSNVEYMTSVGMATLISFQKGLHDRGGTLGLCAVNPDVDRLFRVCGLYSIFGLAPPPEALLGVPAPPRADERTATPPAAQTASYGPYVPENVLASGDRSTTFLAHRVGSSLRVALSVWPIESAADEEQCLKEFRQLAKLEHPGIDKIHDFGAENGYLFVATDYLGGCRLSTWLGLKGRRPSWKETARLIAAVAETLAYLHAAEIYHGDVKPATIIVTNDETPVLLQPVPSALWAGIPETPAYMAPEQVEGRRIDGRADVYSLGVVLYELLCGRPPFGDRPVWERLRRVREEEPPPPRQLVPEVPRNLETICLKAIAKHIADRYSTAADLAADLRGWLAGLSVT
jgi:anti-anti-sigma factor